MKKSSSLESLQTMVHELALAEEGERSYPHRGPVKVVRGRGCNESFRAAVDRSYEAPLGDDNGDVMETVDEEAAGPDAGGALFSRDRTARQSSLSSGAVEGKKAKRRSGLLRGLGSMFRFGRHRKSRRDGVYRTETAEERAEQQLRRRS
ncbi:partitioning defective 3 homolog [Pollicipes pollicipes]|uniref:partitioning defective 3 homolog n=1 Tax=Pollicipes pollicipes TaxID=41117 RepID=UPI0018849BC3|nr:partitioning defective 3 homolog [Pollicipes pollicipes]